MEPRELNHVVYPAAGTVRAWVEVTYRGSYTVDGGPSQAIPATLTLGGPEESLAVLEARPVLTGG